MAYWLLKSEPAECGIEDFARAPSRPITWDGVRNYQARNFLRQMQPGDQVLLYHSSCQAIGLAGILEVQRSAYPDPSQFDANSPYFDPKSDPEAPRWSAVDLVFKQRFARIMGLAELRTIEALAQQPLLRKGNRLSVLPFSEQEWQAVLAQLGNEL